MCFSLTSLVDSLVASSVPCLLHQELFMSDFSRSLEELHRLLKWQVLFFQGRLCNILDKTHLIVSNSISFIPFAIFYAVGQMFVSPIKLTSTEGRDYVWFTVLALEPNPVHIQHRWMLYWIPIWHLWMSSRGGGLSSPLGAPYPLTPVSCMLNSPGLFKTQHFMTSSACWSHGIKWSHNPITRLILLAKKNKIQRTESFEFTQRILSLGLFYLHLRLNQIE